MNPETGIVKLTDLRAYSAPWTLSELLILRSSANRFRLQTPRIILNLTVPVTGLKLPHAFSLNCGPESLPTW